jgi:hypothetical protein
MWPLILERLESLKFLASAHPNAVFVHAGVMHIQGRPWSIAEPSRCMQGQCTGEQLLQSLQRYIHFFTSTKKDRGRFEQGRKKEEKE